MTQLHPLFNKIIEMIRRTGFKIYTKVTLYFTDDNSTVGPNYNVTSSDATICGQTFPQNAEATGSSSSGRWAECLYGSDGTSGKNTNAFNFGVGINSGSACAATSSVKTYIDTTSIITGINGTRMYVSSSLTPAPKQYYSDGAFWFYVSDTIGTISASGSCATSGSGGGSPLSYDVHNTTNGDVQFGIGPSTSGMLQDLIFNHNTDTYFYTPVSGDGIYIAFAGGTSQSTYAVDFYDGDNNLVGSMVISNNTFTSLTLSVAEMNTVVKIIIT
jgi:hypothetical protein